MLIYTLFLSVSFIRSPWDEDLAMMDRWIDPLLNVPTVPKDTELTRIRLPLGSWMRRRHHIPRHAAKGLGANQDIQRRPGSLPSSADIQY
jgi:hypothetical protein